MEDNQINRTMDEAYFECYWNSLKNELKSIIIFLTVEELDDIIRYLNEERIKKMGKRDI